MSKKHHNYTNYSKPQAAPAPVVEEPVAPVVEEVTPAPVVDEEPVVTPDPEPTPDPEIPTAVIGVVTGCKHLNVREAANTAANVVCVITEGAEVEIIEEESTADFYAVCTGAGAEGFCMKKFITIK